MDTIFDKIIRKELPADVVFENERIIAIRDIHPQAPVHLLLIPKQKVSGLQELEDPSLMVEIVQVAQKLAKEFAIDEGYRLITNNGLSAGQTIFHLHFHLLGGKQLGALC